jgi:NitT/TauT family transport system substrate-binding protein
VAPTAASGTERTTLKSGYIPVVIYAPLYVGIERGYYAEEGLTIELTPIVSGNEAVVQLAAGNFDVSMGGANAGLFNAAARGVKFAIVAPLHSERPPITSPLVISAKRTAEFPDIAALRGKKVAVNAIGTATEYWVHQALATAGLTMTDIELLGVPFADIPGALENGAIDAAILTDPGSTINIQRGVVSLLANEFIDGFTATYVYMNEALLARPAVAQAFMRGYLRACRDLQADFTPAIGAIIEKYTNVPGPVVQQSFRPYYSPDGVVPVENLTTLQGYFRSRGLLTYETDLDMSTFVDTSVAREAAAALRR